MVFTYNDHIASGYNLGEPNGVTEELLSTLSAPDPANWYVCYSNGRVQYYNMPSALLGRIKEYTDGLGRKTVYDYNLPEKGF